MLDPLTIAATVIQKEIPTLTLPEAAHVAWEVLRVLQEVAKANEGSEKKATV